MALDVTEGISGCSLSREVNVSDVIMIKPAKVVQQMVVSSGSFGFSNWSQSIYKNQNRLSVPRSQRALTLYPATDCTAVTDISGVSGR